MITPEMMSWCRQVSWRRSDWPIDRDDLFSAAMESVWIATLLPAIRDIKVMSWIIFRRKVSKLWRQHRGERRNFGRAYDPLYAHDIVDLLSVNPAIRAMASDLYSCTGTAVACRACRTKWGRTRSRQNPHPLRIDGLCGACHDKVIRARRHQEIHGRLNTKDQDVSPPPTSRADACYSQSL
jgi:hypothetical protein